MPHCGNISVVHVGAEVSVPTANLVSRAVILFRIFPPGVKIWMACRDYCGYTCTCTVSVVSVPSVDQWATVSDIALCIPLSI